MRASMLAVLKKCIEESSDKVATVSAGTQRQARKQFKKWSACSRKVKIELLIEYAQRTRGVTISELMRRLNNNELNNVQTDGQQIVSLE